jgi:hypothetical protein
VVNVTNLTFFLNIQLTHAILPQLTQGSLGLSFPILCTYCQLPDITVDTTHIPDIQEGFADHHSPSKTPNNTDARVVLLGFKSYWDSNPGSAQTLEKYGLGYTT